MAAASVSQTAQRIASAGSVLGARLRRSRIFMAALGGLSATWHSVSAALGRLWHEVTGFVFLFLAVVFGSGTVREYHRYASEHDSARLAAAAGFTVLFLWFGVSSFWRAWRRPSVSKTEKKS
jgi:hypothetical protein